MTWQTNLINNGIVIGVLLTLAAIIYCRVTKKTFVDVAKEIKEILSGGEDE